MGSVVYLGNTFGAAVASCLLACHPKAVLLVCLILNIATLIIFTATNNYIVFMVCRGFTGLF